MRARLTWNASTRQSGRDDERRFSTAVYSQVLIRSTFSGSGMTLGDSDAPLNET